jgi:hypothetical protein
MRLCTLLLLVPLVSPPSLEAQRLAPPGFASLDELSVETRAMPYRSTVPTGDPDDPDSGTLIFGGLLGGIGGMFVGAAFGASLGGEPCDYCGLVEGLYGAAMGFGLGASTGVHFGNQRQGSFGRSVLITMAIGAAGTLAAIETDKAELLLAIPIAQIASAISIERQAFQVE